MIMVVVIKGFGKMGNLMVKVIILVKPCNIKVDGKRINFMAMVKLYGKMEECIKAIISMAKNKGEELIRTRMERST